MTPMTLLKNNLEKFHDLLGDEFKDISLNRAKARSFTPWLFIQDTTGPRTIEKKGVESDFIRIFDLKFSQEKHYSVAFSFYYLELVEQPTVQYSYKFMHKGKSHILASEKMSVDTFRHKLNEVCALLENSTGYEQKLDILNDYFIDDFAHKSHYLAKINEEKKRNRKIV